MIFEKKFRCLEEVQTPWTPQYTKFGDLRGSTLKINTTNSKIKNKILMYLIVYIKKIKIIIDNSLYPIKLLTCMNN